MRKNITFLLFIFLSFSILAQTDYDSENMQLVGRYANGVSAAVAAIPGYVFTNNGAKFQIFTYDNDELTPASEITLHGPATDIFISAELNLAFVTTNNFGLEIINIADKENPEIISGVHFPSAAEAVYVYESYPDGAKAFVLTSIDGIYSIDISDPQNPQILNIFYTSGEGHDLFGDGWNFKLYAAVENSGFEIIDISNPNQLERLGSQDTNGRALGIYVQDNIAYVADYFNKIRVYDVSNPSAISYLRYYSTTGLTYDIVVSDTLAIVANGTSGVEFIDLNEQFYPYDAIISGTALNVFYCSMNNSVYVASNEGGLYEIDASNGSVKSHFEAEGNAINLFLNDNKLHLATGFYGYSQVDVSVLSNPEKTGSYKFETLYTKGVAQKGNYVFTGVGTEGIKVLDVSDTENITEVASVSISNGTAGKIFITGDTAYVACGSGGVKILDISNPTAPEIIASFNTAYSAQDVYVEGRYAYVADYLDGMEIWDVSDLTNIVGVATTNQPVNGVDVFKKDNYIFLSGLTSGLRIIDCSDLTDVREIAYVRPDNYGETYASFVDDNYIYTADGSKGVHVIDYQNFDSLHVIGYFQTGGRARDILVDDSENRNIFVADEDDGVYILFYMQPDGVENNGYEIINDFVLFQNYPNPFNPTTTIKYTIPNIGGVETLHATSLRIYNILGEEVATLVNAKQSPGNYSVQFNASNLPSGVYFYTLRFGDYAATKKMILLK